MTPIGKKPKATEAEPVVKAKEFTPSVYQQGVYDWLHSNLSTGKHGIVQAVAGSGKTTTGVWLFFDLPKDLDVVFVAFNKHIAAELKNRLPDGSNARTYHSLGMQTLRRNIPETQFDEYKADDWIRSKTQQRWVIPSTKKLAGLCKGNPQRDYDEDDLLRIAFDHDVDLYDDKGDTYARDLIFDLVQGYLSFSINHPEVIDFDDMIWLPNVLTGISFYAFDFILGDEFQDTNAAQMRLAMQSVGPAGTILGVGDRYQSIYRFRGADSNAMDNLKNALQADELPLSISYRCPVAVGGLVNSNWPHINFELPPWAKPGKVYDMMEYQAVDQMRPDDMILCRINADLVPMAFGLIRRGVKATIRGRDIGKGLLALIRKSKADDIPALLTWVNNWRVKEMDKAIRMGAESKIQYIQDRAATLEAMTDDADTVGEVANRCETMFSDDKAGVTLSTVHRAKGLEADRVFILRPDLMPHPAAKKPEDKQQEENLRYVAYTRSLNELIFVR